jgi:hypothetical protein
MSPVVVVGFGAIDAALISQAVYAYRDMRRSDARRRRGPASAEDTRRSR